jgi:hypothetical protein
MIDPTVFEDLQTKIDEESAVRDVSVFFHFPISPPDKIKTSFSGHASEHRRRQADHDVNNIGAP